METKHCTKCGVLQPIENFHIHKRTKKSGIKYYRESACRTCCSKDCMKRERLKYATDPAFRAYRKQHNKRVYDTSAAQRALTKAHTKAYKLRKRQACGPFSDMDAIKIIYANCPAGYHVDHIIPLTHERVCGLHISHNLQYLTASENCSKKNTWEG